MTITYICDILFCERNDKGEVVDIPLVPDRVVDTTKEYKRIHELS